MLGYCAAATGSILLQVKAEVEEEEEEVSHLSYLYEDILYGHSPV